jgi:cell division protein FtsB
MPWPQAQSPRQRTRKPFGVEFGPVDPVTFFLTGRISGDSVLAMRMRRRVRNNFGVLVIPTICVAVMAYFGYSGIFGQRGIMARNATEADLAVKREELSQLRSERHALEHRIGLLNSKALDADMLDEVARGMLSHGRTDEVAVPRRQRQ